MTDIGAVKNFLLFVKPPILLLTLIATLFSATSCSEDGLPGTYAGEIRISDPSKWGVPKKVAVFYEYDPSNEWSLGRKYAMTVRNLLGHFNSEITIINVDDYSRGDLDNFHAAVYIGSVYDYKLPRAFLDDVFITKVPFIWMNYNIWNYFWEAPWDSQDRFGFEFISIIEDGPYDRVMYKNQELWRTVDDRSLNLVKITDLSACKARATIYQSSAPSHAIPYAVQCGNFYYFADNPFVYLLTGYLVFADLLHEILDTDATETHHALLRFEDLAPGNVNHDLLRQEADALYEMGVPFTLGIIPVHTDPEGIWGTPGKTVRLEDDPKFIDTINYMIRRGGTPVIHGYTHQHEGISGIDYEFWEEKKDIPLPDDGYDWALARVEAAIDEWIKGFGHEPWIWETPHYSASPNSYFAISSKFKVVFERFMIFDSLETVGPGNVGGYFDIDYTTQDSPFVLFNTHYGFMAVPENLGYLEKGGQPEYGIDPTPEGKEKLARMYSVVRDSTVTFFYHHWQPVETLYDTIKRIQNAGYSFVDIRDVVAGNPPKYRVSTNFTPSE